MQFIDVSYTHSRRSPFSYTCNRCMKCCYDKRIPIGPYDLIRLAQNQGISTGEFINQCTTDGVVLNRREDQAGTPCIFLASDGCSVHADRPAVCRIYPLGQAILSDGTEAYCLVQPHPETAGEYGEAGTVDSFLDAQRVQPYEEAARAYGELYKEVVAALSKTDVEAIDSEHLDDSIHLLDVDSWVSDYCRANALAFPIDALAKCRLHIKAVRSWLETISD